VTAATLAALELLPAPTAWVFSSGLARCAAQVGMAEVLLEQGLRPGLLVGSSFGSVNAAALTQHGSHLGHLRDMWRRLGSDSLVTNLGSAVVRGFAARRTGRSARELAEIVAGAIPGGADADLPGNLIAVASDLVSGESRVMRTGSTIDAVMASCRLPVLLPPIESDGMLLVDGSLTASAPVEQALAAGAASIILLDTAASAVSEESLQDFRWWQVAAISYNHQIRGRSHHAIARVGQQIPVASITTELGGLFDFEDPDERFTVGRSAAAAALAGPPSAVMLPT
jgi:NTE family protein